MIPDPPEPEPLYYSRAQLATRAGISLRTFTIHENANVGRIMDAREIHDGIGIVYPAHKVRKYLGLTATTATRHRKNKPQTITTHAAI